MLCAGTTDLGRRASNSLRPALWGLGAAGDLGGMGSGEIRANVPLWFFGTRLLGG